MRHLPELSKTLNKDQRFEFYQITERMAKSNSYKEAMSIYEKFMESEKAKSMDTSFLKSFINDISLINKEIPESLSLNTWIIQVEIDTIGVIDDNLTSLEELENDDGYDFSQKHLDWIKDFHGRASKSIEDNPELNSFIPIIYEFRNFSEYCSLSEFNDLFEFKMKNKHFSLTNDQYLSWYSKSKSNFNEGMTDLTEEATKTAISHTSRMLDRFETDNTGVVESIENVLTKNHFKIHPIMRGLFKEKAENLIKKEIDNRFDTEFKI